MLTSHATDRALRCMCAAVLQELYFRHLYAKTQPSLRARCESWDNYCDLFGVILHGAQQQQQHMQP